MGNALLSTPPHVIDSNSKLRFSSLEREYNTDQSNYLDGKTLSSIRHHHVFSDIVNIGSSRVFTVQRAECQFFIKNHILSSAIPVLIKNYKLAESQYIIDNAVARATAISATLTWELHPHVLAPLGAELAGNNSYSQNDNYPFIFRHWIDGTVAERIFQQPPLLEVERLWIIFQMICAVAELHSTGMYHGSLSTSNFLVTGFNTVLLVDIGSWFKPFCFQKDTTFPIACSFFQGPELPGKSILSPSYLSPERIQECLTYLDGTDEARKAKSDIINDTPQSEVVQGETMDESTTKNVFLNMEEATYASDIFALGCCIAEMYQHGKPAADIPDIIRLSERLHEKFENSMQHTNCFSRTDKNIVSLPKLDFIENTAMRTLISKMCALNHKQRPTAVECLNMGQSLNLFPDEFFDFLFPLSSLLLHPQIQSPDLSLVLLVLTHQSLLRYLTQNNNNCLLLSNTFGNKQNSKKSVTQSLEDYKIRASTVHEDLNGLFLYQAVLKSLNFLPAWFYSQHVSHAPLSNSPSRRKKGLQQSNLNMNAKTRLLSSRCNKGNSINFKEIPVLSSPKTIDPILSQPATKNGDEYNDVHKCYLSTELINDKKKTEEIISDFKNLDQHTARDSSKSEPCHSTNTSPLKQEAHTLSPSSERRQTSPSVKKRNFKNQSSEVPKEEEDQLFNCNKINPAVNHLIHFMTAWRIRRNNLLRKLYEERKNISHTSIAKEHSPKFCNDGCSEEQHQRILENFATTESCVIPRVTFEEGHIYTKRMIKFWSGAHKKNIETLHARSNVWLPALGCRGLFLWPNTEVLTKYYSDHKSIIRGLFGGLRRKHKKKGHCNRMRQSSSGQCFIACYVCMLLAKFNYATEIELRILVLGLLGHLTRYIPQEFLILRVIPFLINFLGCPSPEVSDKNESFEQLNHHIDVFFEKNGTEDEEAEDDCISATKDTENRKLNNNIRCTALRVLAQALRRIQWNDITNTINQSHLERHNYYIMKCIMKLLLQFASSSKASCRIAFKDGFLDVLRAAVENKTFLSNTYFYLIDLLKTIVTTTQSEIRIALLQATPYVAQLLSEAELLNIILPYYISFMNAQELEVRVAFCLHAFSILLHQHSSKNRNSISPPADVCTYDDAFLMAVLTVLIPCFEGSLSDTEELVVEAALTGLQYMFGVHAHTILLIDHNNNILEHRIREYVGRLLKKVVFLILHPNRSISLAASTLYNVMHKVAFKNDTILANAYCLPILFPLINYLGSKFITTSKACYFEQHFTRRDMYFITFKLLSPSSKTKYEALNGDELNNNAAFEMIKSYLTQTFKLNYLRSLLTSIPSFGILTKNDLGITFGTVTVTSKSQSSSAEASSPLNEKNEPGILTNHDLDDVCQFAVPNKTEVLSNTEEDEMPLIPNKPSVTRPTIYPAQSQLKSITKFPRKKNGSSLTQRCRTIAPNWSLQCRTELYLTFPPFNLEKRALNVALAGWINSIDDAIFGWKPKSYSVIATPRLEQQHLRPASLPLRKDDLSVHKRTHIQYLEDTIFWRLVDWRARVVYLPYHSRLNSVKPSQHKKDYASQSALGVSSSSSSSLVASPKTTSTSMSSSPFPPNQFLISKSAPDVHDNHLTRPIGNRLSNSSCNKESRGNVDETVGLYKTFANQEHHLSQYPKIGWLPAKNNFLFQKMYSNKHMSTAPSFDTTTNYEQQQTDNLSILNNTGSFTVLPPRLSKGISPALHSTKLIGGFSWRIRGVNRGTIYHHQLACRGTLNNNNTHLTSPATADALDSFGAYVTLDTTSDQRLLISGTLGGKYNNASQCLSSYFYIWDTSMLESNLTRACRSIMEFTDPYVPTAFKTLPHRASVLIGTQHGTIATYRLEGSSSASSSLRQPDATVVDSYYTIHGSPSSHISHSTPHHHRHHRHPSQFPRNTMNYSGATNNSANYLIDNSFSDPAIKAVASFTTEFEDVACSIHRNGKLSCWDFRCPKLSARYRVPTACGQPTCLSVAPNNRTLYVGTLGGYMFSFDMRLRCPVSIYRCTLNSKPVSILTSLASGMTSSSILLSFGTSRNDVVSVDPLMGIPEWTFASQSPTSSMSLAYDQEESKLYTKSSQTRKESLEYSKDAIQYLPSIEFHRIQGKRDFTVMTCNSSWRSVLDSCEFGDLGNITSLWRPPVSIDDSPSRCYSPIFSSSTDRRVRRFDLQSEFVDDTYVVLGGDDRDIASYCVVPNTIKDGAEIDQKYQPINIIERIYNPSKLIALPSRELSLKSNNLEAPPCITPAAQQRPRTINSLSNAHHDAITSLCGIWRPTLLDDDSVTPPLLVTGGRDGLVKIWT